MDQEQTIRSLRLQLRIERAVIALMLIGLMTSWAFGRMGAGRAFILVDGKPVVCVGSERDAKDLLSRVKSGHGCNPSEIEFKQDVVVARAPRDAEPVSRHMAMRVIQRAVSPVVPRWAILVDGKPAVAVPSRTIAGETLDLAKMKFASMAKNLAEEPQFKQKVTTGVTSVDPSIYRKSAEEAVKVLFQAPTGAMTDGVYVVKNGDLAGEIASRHSLKLAELWAINPGVNLHHLQIGDKIHVRRPQAGKSRLTVIVRDQSDRTEPMPPPVLRVSSGRLYDGKMAELSPGRPGLHRVKVATIYENGRKVGSEIQSEEVIREPVPRRIAVGIKHRM